MQLSYNDNIHCGRHNNDAAFHDYLMIFSEFNEEMHTTSSLKDIRFPRAIGTGLVPLSSDDWHINISKTALTSTGLRNAEGGTYTFGATNI